MRREAQALDPDLPAADAATVGFLVNRTLWAPRMGASLLGGLGLLSLFLGAVGLYALLSFAVSQRTHDIGMRMALGALPLDVVRMVLRQGLALVGIGAALGFGCSVLLTRLAASLLYGVSATDLGAFGGGLALLLAVALLAIVLPARRAASIDPMRALRGEA